jgi:dihydrofolate synthase/folylpolyglutamate synthase
MVAPGSVVDKILARLERFGIKLGLETTRELLAQCGNPQESYAVVLVGGTNGKGSTAALLEAMVRSAGYRTGFFCSPHLESPRERLRVEGVCVEDVVLADYLEQVVELGERCRGRPPSYFEALCVAALWWFADQGVQLAVLEVGLGGRLDATNVCEPLLSIITNVDLDHQRILGETLEQIAYEKAGIIRRKRSLVTACGGEPLQVVARRASELDAPLVAIDPENGMEVSSDGPFSQQFELATDRDVYRLDLQLAGEHQRTNAALAVRSAERLSDEGFKRLGREAIERGARRCSWPARLEAVSLPQERTLLLDAAHNSSGVKGLAEHLERHFETYSLLFGALRRKNASEMIGHLAPRSERIVLTRPSSKRAQPPREIFVEAGIAGTCEIVDEPAEALERSLTACTSPDTLVVCGSLYLVGEIRQLLKERFGLPASATEPFR